MSKLDSNYDVAVIGAGPAGFTAAVSLASIGCHTALAGPPFNPDPDKPDTRTTALLHGSVQLLKNIGVWDLCREHAAPLEVIRIIDDTGRLLRAPEIAFNSAEIGGEPFGYNIPNTALVAALIAHADKLKNLEFIDTAEATQIIPETDAALVTLKEGRTISARLVVGADGRNSLCRKVAGITTTSWKYDQMALACNFEHAEQHENASNEFHRPSGPFTTVPLPGRSSSLVWVEAPEEIKRILALTNTAMAQEIEQRLQECLGAISNVGPRAAFPLSGMKVDKSGANRIALVGDAAHVIPPIGAQGLNLGFRDVAALADCAGMALSEGGDPGSEATLRNYEKSRRSDVASRTLAVDLLNRSLISGFVPIQVARGLGLHLLSGLGPLRRLFMREGLAPQSGLPKLMQSPGQAAIPH
jgi:2-octaprenyl-6-methoxyphenol hydroxylase